METVEPIDLGVGRVCEEVDGEGAEGVGQVVEGGGVYAPVVGVEAFGSGVRGDDSRIVPKEMDGNKIDVPCGGEGENGENVVVDGPLA